jgi:hypothetical protein
MWLDDTRGHAVDWSTQRWVQATGRRIRLADAPWLDGPAGDPTGIGPTFFDDHAERHGLRVGGAGEAGLLPDFRALAGPSFDATMIAPAVVHFYEHASAYEVDAWSSWCGAFRPFGWALARIFSRRLQQLNVPLSGLDTRLGMTSRISRVSTPAGLPIYSAWVRELVGTGHVIYAGAYSLCEVPNFAGRCVRIVFPLPNGNAIVIMRPVVQPDGSLLLVSAGRRFGGPGFYFTVRAADGIVWARFLKSFRESIRVYDAAGDVRADHRLSLYGLTCLRLHYRLRRKT